MEINNFLNKLEKDVQKYKDLAAEQNKEALKRLQDLPDGPVKKKLARLYGKAKAGKDPASVFSELEKILKDANTDDNIE